MNRLFDILTDVAAEAYEIKKADGVIVEPIEALKAALAHRHELLISKQTGKMAEPYRYWYHELLTPQGLNPEVLEQSNDGMSLLFALGEMTRYKIEHPSPLT